MQNRFMKTALKNVDVSHLVNKYNANVTGHIPANLFRGSVSCVAGLAYDSVWLSALAFSRLNASVRGEDGKSCTVSPERQASGRKYYNTLLATQFEGAET